MGLTATSERPIRTLRNIFRRKLRAFLTIFGIAIGVFALVVMGSIAQKLTLLVDGGVRYYQGKVAVPAKAEIVDMMRTVNAERGTTFLIVTHNPEVAEACDRTIVMRDGVVVDRGVPVG